MFPYRALGAALLAVPLAGAAGQTTLHAPLALTADSGASQSGVGHRVAWIAGAGVAGAAVFTTFVRLSEQGATAAAERGLAGPTSPVPNHYTDGSLPGAGVSPGQNAPPGPPPPGTPGPGIVITTNQAPAILDTPPPLNQPPNQPPNLTGDEQTVTDGNTFTPPGDGPPPFLEPPVSLGAVVTTPEPESLALLGTGLVALLPAVRRRRGALRPS